MNRLVSLIALGFVLVCRNEAAPAPESKQASSSKEQLTESLIALKSKTSGSTGSDVREKRSFPSSQEPHEATMILAKYILETGDLDGVMEFLQNMIKENKLSDREGMRYVREVLLHLQKIKSEAGGEDKESLLDGVELGQGLGSYTHHEVDAGQKLRHLEQSENEALDLLEEEHSRNINKIHDEEETLHKSKEEIEDRLRVLEDKKQEEEAFMKKKNWISRLMDDVEEGEKDNETILKINSILETQKKESKISKNLYLHVKEALIDSAMENISKLTEETDSF